MPTKLFATTASFEEWNGHVGRNPLEASAKTASPGTRETGIRNHEADGFCLAINDLSRCLEGFSFAPPYQKTLTVHDWLRLLSWQENYGNAGLYDCGEKYNVPKSPYLWPLSGLLTESGSSDERTKSFIQHRYIHPCRDSEKGKPQERRKPLLGPSPPAFGAVRSNPMLRFPYFGVGGLIGYVARLSVYTNPTRTSVKITYHLAFSILFLIFFFDFFSPHPGFYANGFLASFTGPNPTQSLPLGNDGIVSCHGVALYPRPSPSTLPEFGFSIFTDGCLTESILHHLSGTCKMQLTNHNLPCQGPVSVANLGLGMSGRFLHAAGMSLNPFSHRRTLNASFSHLGSPAIASSLITTYVVGPLRRILLHRMHAASASAPFEPQQCDIPSGLESDLLPWGAPSPLTLIFLGQTFQSSIMNAALIIFPQAPEAPYPDPVGSRDVSTASLFVATPASAVPSIRVHPVAWPQRRTCLQPYEDLFSGEPHVSNSAFLQSRGLPLRHLKHLCNDSGVSSVVSLDG
ncbi:hypothetical protein ACRALDRAFT_1093426 [Sodiomyces alcalophilus JCM 7366]|uniref:uncharacterized protein n=1 Tax=Sodiomyces alcalophilus JCM 7366 TaxID=591952 RepID=UPI0039B5D885